MTTIWKFPLDAEDVIELDMPEGAEALHVSTQYGNPCLWARVDPKAPTEKRRFRFAGTGHPLTDDVGRHIGSWLMQGGALVFHLFEMVSP